MKLYENKKQLKSIKSLTSIPFGGPIGQLRPGHVHYYPERSYKWTFEVLPNGTIVDTDINSCGKLCREDPECEVHSCFWVRAGSNHVGNLLFPVISGFSLFGRMEIVDMAI